MSSAEGLLSLMRARRAPASNRSAAKASVPAARPHGAAIEYRGVTKSFQTGAHEVLAVEHFELSVAPNEFVCIVGPSGCGKTTILSITAGLTSPTAGQIRLNGTPITGPGSDRGVVFQQFALFPWKTVSENIGFGLKMKGLAKHEIDAVVRHLAEMVGVAEFCDMYPHQLSGGMQQRVAIARAYSMTPSVLLMDEPFGALDAQTREIMQEELINIWRVNRQTVIFITHSVEEAVYLADRVVVMSRRPGRIKRVIDVGVPGASHWREGAYADAIVQDLFVHQRNEIWELIREELKERGIRSVDRRDHTSSAGLRGGSV